MKYVLLAVFGAVLFASGCKTVDVAAQSQESLVGRKAAAVMKVHKGQRIRIFDPDGKELKKMPEMKRGSVSIYNKDMTGQDNYVFNKKGVITKHQRSYGEDYGKGVWKEVK